MTTSVLRARGLTKRFPGVLANDSVDLDLNRGEIVGLLGENGAGKSTLVKMLFGVYEPDEGTMEIGGEPADISGPADAIAKGMGMVHQHFQLVGPLTVADNVVLGAEPRSGLFIDEKAAVESVRELSEKFGLDVDPGAVVEDLPVGVQQRVEILKALYRGADILILDEPSAVLTPQETDELLEVMRGLAATGVGIIFITHKLREILAVTDRVVVMRGGAVVGAADTAGSTQEGLAELMVGRPVIFRVEKDQAVPGPTVLYVQGLVARDDRDQRALDNISLQVRSGEIVGVAGVEGNGQRELVETLTGLRRITSGTITIDGEDVTRASPRDIHRLGVGHVPEDREKDGLVSSYSVADNLVLNRYFKKPFSKSGLRDFAAIARNAEKLVADYGVATPAITTGVGTLSGGNKQKVIVARELSETTSLVVASQPTRGVDVGSIEFIHEQLVSARDQGAGVLLVSAELDEIFSLADRIVVLYRGRVVGDMPAADATVEQVGLLMAGAVDA